MREYAFTERRRARWERLEELLGRTDRLGNGALSAAELGELARGYRAATTDLATAQTRGYAAQTVAYLNRLVARGHAYVYASAARGGWSRITEFFSVTFPAEVRRSRNAIFACAALFVIATAVAYIAVAAQPRNAYALVPADEIPVVHKSLHDSNFGFDRAFAPAESARIITNNIQVAAIAFAGGMTFGIVTLWAILNNGLMLGALGALFAAKGFGLDFWATIAPHGVIELTCIQIAGGAGLLIAQGILMPGRLRRVDALREAARRAATLLLGVAALLVVAGTIEGFFSPQRLSIPIRLTFGVCTALLLGYYLIVRRVPSRPDTRRAAQS